MILFKLYDILLTDFFLFISNVDYVSLATYDYHGPWESVTGHNSPLYARKNETEQTENVYWSAGYATSNGVEADKLIIGIPFYGRLFRLQSNQSTGFGAPTVGMPPKAKVNIYFQKLESNLLELTLYSFKSTQKQME